MIQPISASQNRIAAYIAPIAISLWAALIGLALVFALMTAVGGSGATRDNGVRVGQPWTGASGIQRTTQQQGGGPSEFIGFIAAANVLALEFGSLWATLLPLPHRRGLGALSHPK